MTTENPNYNVGGTAKDGGLSTAPTVEDGDVDGGNRDPDSAYMPEGGAQDKPASEQTRSTTSSSTGSNKEGGGGGATSKVPDKGKEKAAHVGNPNRNVGGTAEDGGISTADTVADGGPDAEDDDGEFKP